MSRILLYGNKGRLKQMGLKIKDVEVSSLSPMMQHYVKTKNENKDCILFYRLGDFYEMFFEDAEAVSKELELTFCPRSITSFTPSSTNFSISRTISFRFRLRSLPLT